MLIAASIKGQGRVLPPSQLSSMTQVATGLPTLCTCLGVFLTFPRWLVQP